MDQFVVKSKLPSHEIPNISVGEYFLQNITRNINENPQRIAFINSENGTKTTYSEFQKEALHVASSLLSDDLLLSSDDLVMFFGDNSLQYVILIVAMAYLGLPATPAKSANGCFEVAQQLVDSKASVLCISASQRHLATIQQVSEQHPTALEHLKVIILIDGGDETVADTLKESLKMKSITTYQKLLEHSKDALPLATIPHFSVDPQSGTYAIIYTSGSSGLPKGAIHSHRSFLAAVLAMQASKVFIDSHQAVVSFIYPFGHISGIILLANIFASSMTSVLFGPRPDKVAILEAVQQYRISFQVMFTALSADMVATDYTANYNLNCLRVFFFSGVKVPEMVSSRLRNRYNAEVHELYGQTEFMGGVSCMLSVYEPGNVGEPLPNVEMKIVHLSTGFSLPSGEEGEICLRGPNCFLGYLNNAKATAEAIDTQTGFFRTGDVGYADSRGCLFITDRIKELIKYKHWSVSPAEIEVFLQTHPSVVEACVVGVKHATEGAHLRAYVLLKNKGENGSMVTEKEIAQYVQDNMGYQKRLNGGVHFVASIPRTIIGKIDRQHFKNLVKGEVLIEKAEAEK